jgi:DNA repair exonuclease SbcCD nuclease subunit
VPVFVLPGNHDPLSQDSVYRRASWRERPAQVRLLETTEPVAIAGGRALLLPAPLALKKSAEDPTLALRVPEAGSGGVLVGVAHGSLRIEGKHGRDDFPIALEAAARAGLGYLALGHWHGRYVHGERTAYSGTLETTKFGEDNSGLALLVSLDEESGARAPRIEEFRSGRLTWLTRELDAGALELGIQELKRELAAAVLPEGGRQVLLRLRTTGHSDTEAHLRLRELEEELAARYLHVELERRDLATHLVQGRVAELVAEHPFLGGLFDSLAEGTTEPELQGLGAAERDAARRLLAELLIEADEGAHA